MNSFKDLGLLPSLVTSLNSLKIFKPTEIQVKTIPMIMSGQSVAGVSETGSGKTLAYALPVLHLLKELENEGKPVSENSTPRALVLVPTRELGEQVAKVFKSLTHETRLRIRPALGGMTFEHSRRNIAAPFEVLLATPGRLLQLIDKGLVDLTDIRMIIFDEVDQMMDQGFLPDSKTIVDVCPPDVQLILFSATVSPDVQKLLNELFQNADIFRTEGSGKTVSSLITKNLFIKDGIRWPAFEKVIKQPRQGGTLIFANTREQCDKIAKELSENGFESALYRGEMDKSDRRANYKKFRSGEIKLMVATDLAGRGLDLDHIDLVINYHLPQQKENYLHRVGRTARAGRQGTVINLVTERDYPLLEKMGLAHEIPKHLLNPKNKTGKTKAPTASKDRASQPKSRPATSPVKRDKETQAGKNKPFKKSNRPKR